MTVKINSQFGNSKAKTVEGVVLELAKAHCRTVGANVAALTDNSAGVAGTQIVALSTTLTNTALSGTNLATAANVQTGLQNVQDALNELAVKANAYAAALGISTLTYNGGGAAADGTIGSILVSTTGTTVGPDVAVVNPALALLNTAFANVTVVVNEVAKAMGISQLVHPTAVYATVGALTTNPGAGVAPGLSKANADAQLAIAAANVATLAAKLNACRAGNTVALVTPV